ncbi:DUF695 domain-containing protein [Sulfurimonas lithotrophica]|uniref:DUF695 domain-containing protein n=1 Tax=Sulfurimonas lithotrophica TaxID=2590022 RepID=A0A5P8P0Y9_9BACT|nr:DUF695 domain-containing protein [Sulfurimonas lithotrophica]QFR49373.1 DUF695 domain-containing protein [Sulfurimonas lithotrophica]
MLSFYERIEDDKKVKIEVESDIKRYLNNSWLLSVFLHIDSSSSDSEHYMDFLRLKGSLIISLEDEDRTGYVGSRAVDGWTEFYFYSSTSQDIKVRSGDVLQYADYNYESHVVKDEDWSFYHRNLEPTLKEAEKIALIKKKVKENK